MIIWNPWHGCHKVSEGCAHCYMYFLDKQRGHDTSIVYRTSSFNLPLKKERSGEWKIKPGMEVHIGLSTDFFVEEADRWRDEAWRIIKARPDVKFRILTKRASRMRECLPEDWNEGYENVMMNVTCENQTRADERLPYLIELPARHKGFMAAPLIGAIDVRKYLSTGMIEQVLCGGENYDGCRPCHYEWVKDLSDQCKASDTSFLFIETGTCFVKDSITYHIPDKQTQSMQAFKSGLSHAGRSCPYRLQPAEGSLFEEDSKWVPHYMVHCNTCGSKPVCSGCTSCGGCGHSRKTDAIV